MKSVMQSSSNRGGRNSNNGNFQSNGNNRMHPYDRNGGNNSGRGNNMRGRNPNMRNDFRGGNGKVPIYMIEFPFGNQIEIKLNDI